MSFITTRLYLRLRAAAQDLLADERGDVPGWVLITLMTAGLVVAIWALAVDDERGDVPGWVLITLMTAGLVVVIWALAGPALSGLFEQAIQRVSGF